MTTAADFLKNLSRALVPNCADPVLARVMKVYEGPGKNRYSCDLKVLKAGSLEETDWEIIEAPLNPVWAAKKKRGVYALPSEDQVVVVIFIERNAAFPYIIGVYSDEYEAGEYQKDAFVVTDGDGMFITVNADKKFILLDTGKDSSVKLEKDKVAIKTSKSAMVLNGDKFSEKNAAQSLYKILKDFMKLFNSHNMVGPPPKHKLFPADAVKIQKIIARLDALME
jgi:phage baseplate assembly protein gpV